MNSQCLFQITLIIIMWGFPLFSSPGAETAPLPRYRFSATQFTPTTTDTLSQIDQKPLLHMDFLALKVKVKDQYAYGVEWDKRKLERFLGSPLEGRFHASLKDPEKLDIATLMIRDQDKLIEYLTEYGTPQILYRERWSQTLGEQSSREQSTIEPYIATFKNLKVREGAGPVPYAQSTIRTGVTLTLTIQGLQLSGDDAGAEITYEINLRDFYKTIDGLPAPINFISADSASTPFSQTVIQSHFFLKDDVRNEYIFFLTPGKLK